ncbi:MAG: CpsD/CapB family tyrosine-protein kinase, partial [Alphaproteobacteria bacterium]
RRAAGSSRKPELPDGPVRQPVDLAVPAVGPGPQLIVHHEPRSVVTEAFRSLRTNILFSRAGAPPKVIMVASAGMSEGKTVISSNLATTLAESGSRVLLIDSDMRHPSCHPHFGASNQKGLSTFLTGRPFDEVVQELSAPRLSFVAAGPRPPNPAELVGSKRMQDELTRLRGLYDFIVIDSPALIPVTDGVVISRYVDGVVLVVKGQDTPRELVLRARDLLRFANAPILGSVMNNVDLGWGSSYYYGNYYGYYYYGGYDSHDDEEPGEEVA